MGDIIKKFHLAIPARTSALFGGTWPTCGHESILGANVILVFKVEVTPYLIIIHFFKMMEFNKKSELDLTDLIFDARFHPDSDTGLLAAATIDGHVHM